jgi:hypothetical protein
VFSPDGKELPIVRASLCLNTFVTIDKTNKKYNSYIWSRSCFLPGNVEKDTEKLVSRSFSMLINMFMRNYSSANPENPNFYIICNNSDTPLSQESLKKN